jgi:hypothetical protein
MIRGLYNLNPNWAREASGFGSSYATHASEGKKEAHLYQLS